MIEILFVIALITEVAIFVGLFLSPKIRVGSVYFDKNLNAFFQVKRITKDNIVCSGCSNYYVDATTNNFRGPLSRDYIRRCSLVGDLDKRPDLWKHNGIGWKVLKK